MIENAHSNDTCALVLHSMARWCRLNHSKPHSFKLFRRDCSCRLTLAAEAAFLVFCACEIALQARYHPSALTSWDFTPGSCKLKVHPSCTTALMAVSKIRVPFWVPYCKGTPLFGGSKFWVPYFRKPPHAPEHSQRLLRLELEGNGVTLVDGSLHLDNCLLLSQLHPELRTPLS